MSSFLLTYIHTLHTILELSTANHSVYEPRIFILFYFYFSIFLPKWTSTFFNFPSKENSFPQDSVLAVLIFFFLNWPKKYNVLWEGHSFFDDTTLKEFHVCYLAFGISDKTHYEPNGIPMIGKATRKNPPFGRTAIFIKMEKK